MNATPVIVNSGGANIASLQFALQRLGVEAGLSVEPDVLRAASHVILPGVGTAKDAMGRLQAMQLEHTLTALTQPVLGICLGMQLLGSESAEDNVKCLGITDDKATKLLASREMSVPHMGWNQLSIDKQSPLLRSLPDDAWFYFVHSYALEMTESCVAQCDYTRPFSAVIEHDNFFGTQFHPERSGSAGAHLLKNFLEL